MAHSTKSQSIGTGAANYNYFHESIIWNIQIFDQLLSDQQFKTQKIIINTEKQWIQVCSSAFSFVKLAELLHLQNDRGKCPE